MKVKSDFNYKVSLWVLLVSIFQLFSNTSFAQYRLEAATSYVYAFDEHEMLIQNEMVTQNLTHGFELTLNNVYQFKETSFQAVAKVGYRQLYFSGEYGQLNYHGNVSKFIMSLGSRYAINRTFTTGIYIELENNMDFEEFRTLTSDLLRYSVSAELKYNVLDKIGLTLVLARAFYPINEPYLLFNPQNQIRLGLTYSII